MKLINSKLNTKTKRRKLITNNSKVDKKTQPISIKHPKIICRTVKLL